MRWKQEKKKKKTLIYATHEHKQDIKWDQIVVGKQKGKKTTGQGWRTIIFCCPRRTKSKREILHEWKRRQCKNMHLHLARREEIGYVCKCAYNKVFYFVFGNFQNEYFKDLWISCCFMLALQWKKMLKLFWKKIRTQEPK